ncbi:MAG TPA: hypothetical protein VFB42_07525 [Gaiellaceae bacterium]|nr:hypothetical protein [Gaiellaceae bacterium]
MVELRERDGVPLSLGRRRRRHRRAGLRVDRHAIRTAAGRGP